MATTTTAAIPVVELLARALRDVEVTDVTTGDTEGVTLGYQGRYVRITSPDIVNVVGDLRWLADEIESAVLDARQDALDAERHLCWCGTRLEADEATCGASRCLRIEYGGCDL